MLSLTLQYYPELILRSWSTKTWVQRYRLVCTVQTHYILEETDAPPRYSYDADNPHESIVDLVSTGRFWIEADTLPPVMMAILSQAVGQGARNGNHDQATQ